MLCKIDDKVNAMFCKSDFSDITEKLQLLQDSCLRNEIAENGYRMWRRWISQPEHILYQGFEKYLA
jgi:hypothetical protein